MRALGINGRARKQWNTEKAHEGAASAGAEAEMNKKRGHREKHSPHRYEEML